MKVLILGLGLLVSWMIGSTTVECFKYYVEEKVKELGQ